MELLTLVGCFVGLGGSDSSSLDIRDMAFCSNYPLLRNLKSGNSENVGFGI